MQAEESDERDEDFIGELTYPKGTQRQHMSSSPAPEAQIQRIKEELAKSRSRAVSVPGTQPRDKDEEENSYEMVGETQIEGSERATDVVSFGENEEGHEEEEEEEEEGDE